MIFKQYILKDDESLISFVQDLRLEDVVLKDYFYFTQESFIDSENFYTEKQIARILSLIDTEYVTLINQYLGSKEGEYIEESYSQIQEKIDEINQKIQKSKDYEEATTKINEIQENIKEIDGNLSTIYDIERKISDANKNLQSYIHLSRYNLQKIHQDLVAINSQIERFEEDLLNKKIVDIKRKKKKYSFDRGKMGVAIGLFIGMVMFGAIFWLILSSLYISIFIWGLGILLAMVLITFSRHEVVEENSNYSSNYEYKDLNNLLDSLRNQRDAILKMLDMRNTNEFFIAKARYHSIKKTLDYLNLEKKRLTSVINCDELKQKRQTLIEKLKYYQDIISEPSVLLSPGKYRKYYRSLDELKQILVTQDKVLTNKLNTEDIPKRLHEIRKEFMDKIPAYIENLSYLFKQNYDKIFEYISRLIAKYKVNSFTVSKNLTEWESLSFTQRMLVQYALAHEVYQKNFVFIVEEIRKFGNEGIMLVNNIINDSDLDADGNEFISIDYVKVF